MTFAGPLDLVLTAALAIRRFGFARTVLGSLLLLPAYLYSLPPQSCSCIRPIFVRCTYGRPYLAAMKSDLKNLASQQEIYYSDQYRYSSDPAALAFTASSGVSITIRANEKGWSARATHPALGEQEACAIWYGEGASDWLGMDELGLGGEITCTS